MGVTEILFYCHDKKDLQQEGSCLLNFSFKTGTKVRNFLDFLNSQQALGVCFVNPILL